MLNECRQLWASRASQALDARLTNQVVAPSLDGQLEGGFSNVSDRSSKPSEVRISARAVERGDASK